MGLWKKFDNWTDKIFPKSDTNTVKVQKIIAAWQILASAAFTLGATLLAIGLTLKSLSVSTLTQKELVELGNEEKNRAAVYFLKDFGDNLMQTGDFYWKTGIVIIVITLVSIILIILKEKGTSAES